MWVYQIDVKIRDILLCCGPFSLVYCNSLNSTSYFRERWRRAEIGEGVFLFGLVRKIDG